MSGEKQTFEQIMHKGGSIFQNAKLQCAKVAKCKKKLTNFKFFKIELLFENPPTLFHPLHSQTK